MKIKNSIMGLLFIGLASITCDSKKAITVEMPIAGTEEVYTTTYKIIKTSEGKALRSEFNSIIQPIYNACNGVEGAYGITITYSTTSIPFGTSTCIYDGGQRVSVKIDQGFADSSITIDDVVGSEAVKQYVEQFEKDRALLEKAGIL